MAVSTRSQGRTKCLVTGGLGFLGQHMVKQLVETGKYDVTVFDIRDATVPGATVIKGDLRDLDQVTKAVDGCDVIFHCATAAPTGENALNIKLMHSVNVLGTQHIITACQKAGVKKLVYTSSSSVVFEGKHCNNVDETFPYATKPLDYYTQTKIEGEKLALAANGVGGVATTALRPAGIFGDGDPLFLPTVIERAKKGAQLPTPAAAAAA
jgi:sterol-4alpha-carboxylate 3-dehydrogenase (decarboxylating)